MDTKVAYHHINHCEHHVVTYCSLQFIISGNKILYASYLCGNFELCHTSMSSVPGESLVGRKRSLAGSTQAGSATLKI